MHRTTSGTARVLKVSGRAVIDSRFDIAIQQKDDAWEGIERVIVRGNGEAEAGLCLVGEFANGDDAHERNAWRGAHEQQFLCHSVEDEASDRGRLERGGNGEARVLGGTLHAPRREAQNIGTARGNRHEELVAGVDRRGGRGEGGGGQLDGVRDLQGQ